MEATGLCFKTEEEAKKMLEYLKVRAAMIRKPKKIDLWIVAPVGATYFMRLVTILCDIRDKIQLYIIRHASSSRLCID